MSDEMTGEQKAALSVAYDEYNHYLNSRFAEPDRGLLFTAAMVNLGDLFPHAKQNVSRLLNGSLAEERSDVDFDSVMSDGDELNQDIMMLLLGSFNILNAPNLAAFNSVHPGFVKIFEYRLYGYVSPH